MTLGTNLIAQNLSMSIESLIVLVLTLSTMMFSVKSFKLSITGLFSIMGATFIWFYSMNMNWIPPLIIMLMAFIIMIFLFIPISKTSPTGGLT